jgi:hypothetical protein
MQHGGAADTLRWFDSDACHVFHVMNAWDDGATVVAYVMQSETAPGLPDAEGRPGDPDAMAARLCRWTFDLSSADTGFRREYLDDLVAEFPRIDERYTGRRNRYGFYTCHGTSRARDDSESVLYDSLARFDFDIGERTMHTLPHGDVVSEPVFVRARSTQPRATAGCLPLPGVTRKGAATCWCSMRWTWRRDLLQSPACRTACPSVSTGLGDLACNEPVPGQTASRYEPRPSHEWLFWGRTFAAWVAGLGCC